MSDFYWSGYYTWLGQGLYGNITFYNGGCGQTVTVPNLNKNKITNIIFNLQTDWFNSYRDTYIDYIELTE